MEGEKKIAASSISITFEALLGASHGATRDDGMVIEKRPEPLWIQHTSFSIFIGKKDEKKSCTRITHDDK